MRLDHLLSKESKIRVLADWIFEDSRRPSGRLFLFPGGWVAPAVLPQFVAEFRQLLDRFGTTAAYYAHASVGCLHFRPLIDLSDPDDLEMMQAIATEATDLVMRYGGALSGEHGDGRLRSHLLQRCLRPNGRGFAGPGRCPRWPSATVGCGTAGRFP